MTEKAIEFLQEWIGEKIHAPQQPAKLEQEAEQLAKECARQAANAGVRLEDIEEEVGDLEELIAIKLEDAAEAQKGGSEG
jgi:nucleotide-binding universal stress UspA family protein